MVFYCDVFKKLFCFYFVNFLIKFVYISYFQLSVGQKTENQASKKRSWVFMSSIFLSDNNCIDISAAENKHIYADEKNINSSKKYVSSRLIQQLHFKAKNITIECTNIHNDGSWFLSRSLYWKFNFFLLHVAFMHEGINNIQQPFWAVPG